MSYDAEVRFSTSLDNKGLMLGIRDAARNLKKLEKEFNNTSVAIKTQEANLADLQRKYDALVKGEKTPASLKAMKSALQEIKREIQTIKNENKALLAEYDAAVELAEQFRPFGGEPFEQAANNVDRIADSLRPVWERMDGLDAKARDLSASLSGVKLTPETSAEAQFLADKISIANEKLAQSKTHQEELKRQIAGANEKLAALNSNASKTANNMGRTDLSARRINSSLKGVLGRIVSLVGGTRLFGKEMKRSQNSVTDFAARLKQLVVAAFVFNVIRKGLNSLKSYLGGLLKTNAQFMQSLTNVKVNLMTAFQPIYEAILPALNTFMSALSKVTAYLAAFVSLLFGKSYSASRNAAKAANEQAEAYKNAGSAAKKAAKNIQSFDEINRQTSESGGDSGSADSVSNLFDEAEMPDIDLTWVEKFKEKIEEMGLTLADIWDYVKIIGTGLLAWTVSKLLGASLLDAIGWFSTIAGLLLTIKGLTDAWSNGVSWKNLLEMLGGVGLTALGLLSVFGKVGGAIGLLVGGLVILVTSFRDAFENGLTLENLIGVFAGIALSIGGLAILFGTVGAAIGMIVGGLALLVLGFKDWIDNGKSLKAIAAIAGGFLLIAGAIALLTGSWIPLLVGAVAALIAAIIMYWEDIKAFFVQLWEDWKRGWSVIWDKIKTIWGSAAAWFAEKVIKPIKDAFKGAINFLLGLAEGFANGFIKAINFIIKALNKIKFNIPDWVPAIGGKNFGINIPTLNEISIPRLARGGIIDSATIAMIGEKGREAVVPLSRDAEWMKPINDLREEQEITNSLLRQLIEVVASQEQGQGRTSFSALVKAITDEQRSQARMGRGFGVPI